MKTKKLLATVALSAMLLTGCTFGSREAIIKVNGQNITQAQYNEAFDKEANNSMLAQMGVDLKSDKNGVMALILKDKVINELIVKSLIDQEMAKKNIKVTKEDTNKELKTLIDKIGSKEKFNEILKQHNISAAQFRNDLNEEVKMKKLVKTISNATVSEADAKKFYKENIDKFKYPEKVRASHILIAVDAEAITSNPANKNLSKSEIQAKVDKELAAKLEKAKKILAEVKKSPESFAAIAKVSSDDTKSASQGGDLGFFGRHEMVEPFAKVAFTQKPNTVSDIVQSPFGYHIILVKDRMKAGQEPFEKVKADIMNYLESQNNIKVLEGLIESLKKQAKIEYVNKEYNPASIQEALKNQAKSNPTLKEAVSPESQSATPAPLPKK